MKTAGGRHSGMEAVTNVEAERISTRDTAEPAQREKVPVIREVPVTIDVDGWGKFTLLCAPVDLEPLAAGFLLGEGVIDSIDEVDTLRVCDSDSRIIRVHLEHGTRRSVNRDRNMMIVSSCGACGIEDLARRIEALPAVGNKLTIKANILRTVYEALHERQRLFEICGGTHAAAVFDDAGRILTSAEDTGRHNALDKAIGRCLLADVRTAGRGVALTSRISLEMVSRCARAGIELLAAVSAPTSLAIETADRCNITLCAFVRETRATVFTHPTRIRRL
jgi:FdhD protein